MGCYDFNIFKPVNAVEIDCVFYNWVIEMSTEIPLQSKPKSPYKNLLSSSKGKMSGGLARKIYMNELSSKHKIRSIESE